MHILLSDSANCTVPRAVVLTQFRRVTDGRTDRRTDGQTDGRTGGIAVASTALAKRHTVKTEPLICAFPRLEDIFDQIAEEEPSLFSALDLRAGYYRTGLEKARQPYTTFSTKILLFHFTRLNKGCVDSRSVFTQSLYKIFAAKILRHMITYVDDVFMMYRDVDEHIEFLRKIVNKFREYFLSLRRTE